MSEGVIKRYENEKKEKRMKPIKKKTEKTILSPVFPFILVGNIVTFFS